jgi:hypothetical protein
MCIVDLCLVLARNWGQFQQVNTFVRQLCNKFPYDKTLPCTYESKTYQLYFISFKCTEINDEVKR